MHARRSCHAHLPPARQAQQVHLLETNLVEHLAPRARRVDQDVKTHTDRAAICHSAACRGTARGDKGQDQGQDRVQISGTTGGNRVRVRVTVNIRVRRTSGGDVLICRCPAQGQQAKGAEAVDVHTEVNAYPEQEGDL